MTLSLLSAVGLILLALAASACGGAAENDRAATTPGPFTAAEVAEVFKRETGDELRVYEFAAGASPEKNAARLAMEGRDGEIQTEPPSPEMQTKYGRFTIYVHSDPAKVKMSSFGAPDEAGRFWVTGIPERGANAGWRVWTVYKIYGPNVRLQWSADDRRERRLDARWYRLDSALSPLDQSAR